MRKNLTVIILPMSICLSAQVGVNTATPTATVDIVSKTALPANKVLNIQNSNATNANNLSMYEDSRSYIGKPDNVAPNATNDALINIYGTATRSNLKLDNAPSTENQLNAASRPGVDYNHLTPAYIDVNGHVVKAYDPYSAIATSANFDGGYTVPNTAAGIKIVDATSVGLITFKVATGLVLGPPGTGTNIISTVNFGINTGFSYSDFVSGSGSTSSRYPVTVSMTDNGNTSIASYTASITFDFATGVDLVFFYQNGAIYARNTGTGNIGIAVMQSKRYR
ncbi:hypothetical protein [Chryseobacterium sp. JUb7]|uniref:hypothetical protein n=1 Tax=Chryseobacterium sp. JUb7 TaxID=2940599 RepID=UPI00216A51FA|nr:hypothetical protein [Chryseobacterium sp. JUb7]MCS3529096.1 hypothetical protein [Chryseobacterium sp. JUb7]